MVTAAFKRYGTIERLSMRTRNLFQHAYIRYTSADAIKDFKDTSWCSFIAKHCVRVLPLTLTAEERLLRQQFCLKLAGIPRNCQAGHLVGFLKSINAKSCFIPRNLQTYRQQNFAFVNFCNKDDFDRASLSSYSFQDSRLYWCDQKAKTCFSCGSPNHSVKVCPKRANARDPKNLQLKKLYNKYHPAQHKNHAKQHSPEDNPRSLQPNQQKQPKSTVAPPTKCTHSDVDPSSSSSDEPDEEIANIRTDMQKDMSMMKNMFTNFFTTMGLGGPSEEEHDDIVDDEMIEADDDEVVDEFDTL